MAFWIPLEVDADNGNYLEHSWDQHQERKGKEGGLVKGI